MKKISLLFMLILCSVAFGSDDVIGLDVRTSFERAIMSAPGSLALSINDFSPKEISQKLPNKNAQIHVFCAAGVRAQKAKSILNKLGYSNVKNIGTYKDWNQFKNK